MDQKKHPCYRHSTNQPSLQETQEEIIQRLEKHCPENSPQLLQLWDLYSKLPSHCKNLALDGILYHSCFPHLSYLSNVLPCLTRVDFISHLPFEIAVKIFQYLDGASLCHAAQVCKAWKVIADDDLLWQRMCNQHINKKCTKCGWGLPLMQQRPTKKVKLCVPEDARCEPMFQPLDFPVIPQKQTVRKKPWKKVYSERLIVERNWRKPRFSTKVLSGHSDGVMSVHFDKSRNILVTGSYDHTLRAWNTESGECLSIMKGHLRCVRDVQFDETKIISCSIDRTIRIWCLKTFRCVRVISGHTSGVLCLHFYDKMLASGAEDGVIRVWNLALGCSFTLTGHSDFVNKVQILPGGTQVLSCSDDGNLILWDIASQSLLKSFSGHNAAIQTLAIQERNHSDVHGKIIVTGSLDNTIKLWNFDTGKCIDTLFGHVDGVWSVCADSLRIVSGSHDKTIKVWDISTGKLMYSLDTDAAIYSVWISDTVLITGDENGNITIRDYLNA